MEAVHHQCLISDITVEEYLIAIENRKNRHYVLEIVW